MVFKSHPELRKYVSRLDGLPSYLTAVLGGLYFQNADTRPLQALTDAQWNELLRFTDLAHLTLPLFSACKEVIPRWVASQMKQNISDNKQRTHNIKREYNKIAEAFTAAGVEHLLVKGFAQYPEFIKEEELRFQSDIDLYCPETEISRAFRILVELGYVANRTLDGFPSDHLPIMARSTGWVWRGNMYDPDMPPSIDLHFCLWNAKKTRIPVNDIDQFWLRREFRPGNDDFSFPTLSKVDNLGFCALHILRDLLRGDWVIHHVYEVAYFLHHHSSDDRFWGEWLRTHDESLRDLELIAFWLANDWFQCVLPPIPASEMLRMSPPVKAWLQEFGASPLTGMFRPNKDGVWLHLCLLSSGHDRLMVLRDGFIPTHIPSLNAPGQNTTKSRRVRRFWPRQPVIRYIFHIVFRIAFHLQMLLPSFYRGAKLWRSQRKLKRESQIFSSPLSST